MVSEDKGGFENTLAPDTARTVELLPISEQGSFPRVHLTNGENILWEAKPALLPYVLKPIIYSVICIMFVILMVDAPREFYAFVLGIILAWMVIGVIAGIVRQRRTSFALTNRRIMTQYGVFSQKFADCGHDKVQNSTIVRSMTDRAFGWGSIMFATAGTMGGISTRQASKMMSYGGAVLWLHVSQPIPVYKYAQAVMGSSRKLAKARDYHLMAGILKRESTLIHRSESGPTEQIGQDEFGYCTNCGKKMKKSWKFCRHCGRELC
jgi:membrane protein YdbS with pleckstrin-like domain